MNFQQRADLTFKIWFILIGGLVGSLIFTAERLGVWSLAIVFLIIGAGITTTGFLWKWGGYDDRVREVRDESMDVEKAKRNRLALALRDLSDAELTRLRQRLSDGDIDDDHLAALLDESASDKAKRR